MTKYQFDKVVTIGIALLAIAAILFCISLQYDTVFADFDLVSVSASELNANGNNQLLFKSSNSVRPMQYYDDYTSATGFDIFDAGNGLLLGSTAETSYRLYRIVDDTSSSSNGVIQVGYGADLSYPGAGPSTYLQVYILPRCVDNMAYVMFQQDTSRYQGITGHPYGSPTKYNFNQTVNAAHVASMDFVFNLTDVSTVSNSISIPVKYDWRYTAIKPIFGTDTMPSSISTNIYYPNTSSLVATVPYVRDTGSSTTASDLQLVLDQLPFDGWYLYGPTHLYMPSLATGLRVDYATITTTLYNCQMYGLLSDLWLVPRWVVQGNVLGTFISTSSSVLSAAGYDLGYNDGYNQGNSDGYTAGENYANSVVTETSASYIAGKDNGYNLANNTVTDTSASYIKGKQDGISAGSEYTFYGLISSVVDVPVRAFTSLFDFNILGVNLTAVIGVLLMLCFVMTVVRLFVR